MSASQFLKEYNSLPDDFRKEVEDFIGFLKNKLVEKKSGNQRKPQKRKLGLAKGKARMSPDFDAPLDDMKEYME